MATTEKIVTRQPEDDPFPLEQNPKRVADGGFLRRKIGIKARPRRPSQVQSLGRLYFANDGVIRLYQGSEIHACSSTNM